MEIKTLLSSSKNYTSKRTSDVKYIVIHYTGNKGDTAYNNAKYFKNGSRNASAHYFVDEDNIYLSVPETARAWHCGGSLQGSTGHSFYKVCTNDNSIGIEMCLLDKNGNIRNDTVETAITLTRSLMQKYSVTASNVIRHWDVTGKQCPAPFVGNDNSYWNNFKSRILEEEIDMELLNELQSKIDALTARVVELESSKEPVYATVNEVPDWGRELIQSLVDRGLLASSQINMPYSLLRTLVILSRADVFDEKDKVYTTIDEIPSWGKDAVEKLIALNKLSGSSDNNLNISFTMLRILVILDRCEAFDINSKITRK